MVIFGLDNDGDEDIDSDDADCQAETEGLCSDGDDNDGDELTDFNDPDCQGVIGLDAAAPQSGNDTTDVEPTSSSISPTTSGNAMLQNVGLGVGAGLLTYTTTTTNSQQPQLIQVQTGGEEECTADPKTPRIATDATGQDVYLVWEDGCGEIKFRASHDGGETFGDILNLSNSARNSIDPRVATSASGDFVHVTWQESRSSGNDEIFYSRSTNGGESFNAPTGVGTPKNLSNTPRASNDHQLVAEGANVYVVWVDYTTGNGDIYFKRSNNNGQSFISNPTSTPTNLSRGSRLSFLASRDPDMAAQGSKVSVIWTVYPDRAATRLGEIIFRESTTSGSSFGSHIVVSKTPRIDSKEPQIDYTPGAGERYAAWHDKGGPARVNTPAGTFNVLASESDNGRTFSASVNLSDDPNNPNKTKQTSQLEVVHDVAVWDPSSRRG